MNPPKEVLPAFCLIFGSVLQTCAVCSYLTLNPILIVPKGRLLLSGCGTWEGEFWHSLGDVLGRWHQGLEAALSQERGPFPAVFP